MAMEVLTDALVSVNAVDLSDHVKDASVTPSVALKEASAMGDPALRRLAGLKDAKLTVTFFNDWAAGKVDATLWAVYAIQTALKFRKSKTLGISATNPEYQFNGMWSEYPIAAKHGDEATTTVTFELSDGVALIRATV